jgi:hypothetical protein
MRKFTEEEIEEIRKDPRSADWAVICKFYKLSEDFIEEFHRNVHWRSIFAYQNLSEDFIRKFKYKAYFWNIVMHQNLSEEFLVEFIDEIDVRWLRDNKKISKDLKEKIIAMKELMNQ